MNRGWWFEKLKSLENKNQTELEQISSNLTDQICLKLARVLVSDQIRKNWLSISTESAKKPKVSENCENLFIILTRNNCFLEKQCDSYSGFQRFFTIAYRSCRARIAPSPFFANDNQNWEYTEKFLHFKPPSFNIKKT